MSANLRDEFVSASVPIEEVAATGISFKLAILVKKAGGFTGGARYRTYTSAAGVNADADLSSTQKGIVATAFGQALSPSSVYVIMANTSSSEDYDDAATAAVNAGLVWYYTACESRVAADIKTVSDWVQTSGAHLYLACDDDNDWIDTAGGPSALASGGASDITANSRTMVVYHPTAAQAPDVAVLAAASAINVDTNAPAFNAKVAGVTTYSLTTTEADQAYANKCLYLVPPSPGASTRYPSARSIQTIDGTPPSAIVAADWFSDRWKTAVMGDYLDFATKNQRYPWNADGIALAVGRAYEVKDNGLRAGHFTKRADEPDGGHFEGSLVSDFGISLTGALAYLDATKSISLLAPLTRGV